MKKSITSKSHFEQINLALVYVQNHYESNITAEDLAEASGYSIFHFHRIFKEIIGENVNDYIKNTRLEKASNLLLYNKHKTIEQISKDSGFSTATGFSASFKKKFKLTPKQWREGAYKGNTFDCDISMIEVNNSFKISEPTIINNNTIPIMYLRVYGYNDDITSIWNHMNEWCERIGIFNEPHRYIGLFHNHPSFSPYNTARYLACIETNESRNKNGKVGKCVIRKGKFAQFNFTCKHDELYKLMHLAYINWLSNSEYEVRNFPAYVEYKNPENLVTNGILECEFYMPVQLRF